MDPVTGYCKCGPANDAASAGDTAFSATFIPTFLSGQLIVCGTAECASGGVVMLKIEYRRVAGPAPWQTITDYAASGSGHVVVGPTSNPVVLTKDEEYEFRITIQGTTTHTTQLDDYFSVTLLELDE